MHDNLRERLAIHTLQDTRSAREFRSEAETSQDAPARRRFFNDLKARLHQNVLDQLDLERMKRADLNHLRRELKLIVEKMIVDERLILNENERIDLVTQIQNEMLGLGPLEPLLADPTISDILVNTYSQVYVERRGRLELTSVSFSDDAHLLKIIDKIVSRVGRHIDESSPMVDARLPDGSRVNAIIPPLAIDGPLLSIRRFGVCPLTMADLVNNQSLTEDMALVLEGLAKAKINVMISGGTGSGKTTLLNILSSSIPAHERVVTIEDAAELQLQQPHVVRLETRPANIESKGEVTQRALVRNALRMRPDRIILGEVRGAEALDMLQAMNTGHDGSMTTVHANSPRDALSRVEIMVSMAGMNMPAMAMRQQISSALSVIVQSVRLVDGRRKIVSVQEITGMEGEMISMQPVFSFKQTGIGDDGRVLGTFSPSGVWPKFTDRLTAYGVTIPRHVFDPDRQFS